MFLDSHDELIVNNISARDSSNTHVAPFTAENEIVYITHSFRFPSFEMCAVKTFGVRRTGSRALDFPAATPLSLHNYCAKPLRTNVICTRDCHFASRAAH